MHLLLLALISTWIPFILMIFADEKNDDIDKIKSYCAELEEKINNLESQVSDLEEESSHRYSEEG